MDASAVGHSNRGAQRITGLDGRLPPAERPLQAVQSCTCLAGKVRLNYDTFGDSRKPAVLCIMGLMCQKVRVSDDFCRQLSARGFHVIRFDNRDVGRSSRVAESPIQRFLSLLTLPAVVVKAIVKENRVIFALFVALFALAAWRHKTHRRGYKRLASLLGVMGVSSAVLGSRTPYKIEDMALDAVRLLDTLSIVRAHIIGYSMGGMIAQVIAEKHPSRVEKLVLISTMSPRASLTTSPGIYGLLKLQLADGGVHAFNPLVSEKQRRTSMGSLWVNMSACGGNTKHHQRLVQREQERGFQEFDAVLRQVMAVLHWAGDRTATPFTTSGVAPPPSLLIHGMQDPLVPLNHGMELARLMGCKRCVVLPNQGHDTMQATGEDAQEMLNAITVHLSSKADAQATKPSTTASFEFNKAQSVTDLDNDSSKWVVFKKSSSAAILDWQPDELSPR